MKIGFSMLQNLSDPKQKKWLKKAQKSATDPVAQWVKQRTLAHATRVRPPRVSTTLLFAQKIICCKTTMLKACNNIISGPLALLVFSGKGAQTDRRTDRQTASKSITTPVAPGKYPYRFQLYPTCGAR